MNKDMTKLLKVIVAQFEDTQKTQPHRAGLRPGFLRGRFKKELKNSVCFALLKGNALAAHNQGTNGVAYPP